MRYSLVLWDFDGTLADTFGCTLRIYNELADRHGYRRIEDPAAVRDLSTIAFLRQHDIPLLQVPRLIRAVLSAQRDEMATIRLFAGLAAVLEHVYRSGATLAVLSSNRADNIRACLHVNGVADWFAAIHGYQRLLGKARGIRRVMQAAGVAPQQVVYIGDEVRDVQAARSAGVSSLAVSWGYQARHLLAAQQPDHLIDHPEQLLPQLQAAVAATPGPA